MQKPKTPLTRSPFDVVSGWDEREIAPVHEPVAVEQHQAGASPRSTGACGGSPPEAIAGAPMSAHIAGPSCRHRPAATARCTSGGHDRSINTQVPTVSPQEPCSRAVPSSSCGHGPHRRRRLPGWPRIQGAAAAAARRRRDRIGRRSRLRLRLLRPVLLPDRVLRLPHALFVVYAAPASSSARSRSLGARLGRDGYATRAAVDRRRPSLAPRGGGAERRSGVATSDRRHASASGDRGPAHAGVTLPHDAGRGYPRPALSAVPERPDAHHPRRRGRAPDRRPRPRLPRARRLRRARAADGAAALATFRARRPDALVLDLGLPRVDGLDVVGRSGATPRLSRS